MRHPKNVLQQCIPLSWCTPKMVHTQNFTMGKNFFIPLSWYTATAVHTCATAFDLHGEEAEKKGRSNCR